MAITRCHPRERICRDTSAEPPPPEWRAVKPAAMPAAKPAVKGPAAAAAGPPRRRAASAAAAAPAKRRASGPSRCPSPEMVLVGTHVAPCFGCWEQRNAPALVACLRFPNESCHAPPCWSGGALAQLPPEITENRRKVCGFGDFRRSFGPLGAWSVSKVSERIAQELDFLGGPWPGAGALARGLVVPGRDPGVSRQQEGRGRARVQPGLRRGRAWDRATAEHGSSWRQQGPGPRQSQGSARAEAGQSVGQSHCRAWQQLAAARGHHGGCIPGVLAARKNEENDHVSSNSDLKSGVIPILLGYSTQFPSARLAPRAGPGPRQSQGSARAEAGQSVGQ
eukprot:gene22491-biopygen16255